MEYNSLTLINDDCNTVLDYMIASEIKVELIITSPPYDEIRTYNGTCSWNFDKFKEIAKKLYNVLNDNCVLVWVVSDQTINGGRTLTAFKQAIYFQEIGFTFCDDIIFSKNSPAFPPKRTSKRYGNIYEHMFVFSKGKIRDDITLIADKPNKYAGLGSWGKCNSYDKEGSLKEGKKVENVPDFSLRNNIWTYTVGCNKDKKFGKHPAVFPEQLATDHILSWSVEGDTVFDPFNGSGTTSKCALLNNRKFIGTEYVEEYYNISIKRLQHYFPNEIINKEKENIVKHDF